MAKTLQFRRGTTANLASITGAVGELFVDTDKDTIVVMDGITAGGFRVATEPNLFNTSSTDLSGPTAIYWSSEFSQLRFNTTDTGWKAAAQAAAITADKFVITTASATYEYDNANYPVNSTISGPVSGPFYGFVWNGWNPSGWIGSAPPDNSVTSITGFSAVVLSQIDKALSNTNSKLASAYNTANNAYDAANSGISLAQAAYDQANTVLVLNANYSKSVEIANTYGYDTITETYQKAGNYQGFTIAADDSVGTYLQVNPAGSSLSYGRPFSPGDITPQISISDAVSQIQNNVGNLAGQYVEFIYGSTRYAAKIKQAVNFGTGTALYLHENTVDALPNLTSMTTIDGLLTFSGNARLNFLFPTAGSELITTLNVLKANANFVYSNTSSSWSVTANGQPTTVGTTISSVKINGDYKPVYESNSINSVQINGEIPAKQTWTFDLDGSFDSNSALIGEVLISNDIITPLALDSYGLVDPTQTGTLTVNGNLDVLGTITGGKFEVFTSDGELTEKYKTYLEGQVAVSFTLPSNGTVGDWVQVICGNMAVTVPTGSTLTGYVSAGSGQTVALGAGNKINLFVCENVAGGLSYWRVYGISQTPYNV
jgi:hypothetical protein